MSDVRLYIGSSIYTGWKKVTVTRAIDQAASVFTVSLSANFSDGVAVLPVAPGEKCRVALNQQTVITGYVDGITGNYSEGSHDYSITGRSAIGDLVDCSAIVKGGEIRNQTVEGIAKIICQPFGIPVVVAAGVDVGDPLLKHRVDDGAGHEVIERACRRRGLILSSSVDGALVIGQLSNKKISQSLVFGENVKSASGRFTMNNRFSEYRVKGQSSSEGSIDLEQQVQPLAIEYDRGVKRYRPLVVDAEEGEVNLSKRGRFEASTRLGRGAQITLSVQGWGHDDGLWEPNVLVRVVNPYFRIDGWFLISQVVYSYGEEGTQCEITVMPKEAFTVQKLTVKSESKAQEWGDVFGKENSTAPST
jgi:prophage tail gpP-like protein